MFGGWWWVTSDDRSIAIMLDLAALLIYHDFHFDFKSSFQVNCEWPLDV